MLFIKLYSFNKARYNKRFSNFIILIVLAYTVYVKTSHLLLWKGV